MRRDRDIVPASHFDQTGRDDILSGGVRMIPIETPKGTFKVWTRRVGNNPTISDKPDEPELWDLPRFVDEVEQVRLARGLACSVLQRLRHEDVRVADGSSGIIGPQGV